MNFFTTNALHPDHDLDGLMLEIAEGVTRVRWFEAWNAQNIGGVITDLSLEEEFFFVRVNEIKKRRRQNTHRYLSMVAQIEEVLGAAELARPEVPQEEELVA